MSAIPQSLAAYGFTQSLVNVFPAPLYGTINPTTNVRAKLGTLYVNTVANSAFILTSYTSGLPVWSDITGGGGSFTSLTVTPGPISLTGTTLINATGNAATGIGTNAYEGTITLSNPTCTGELVLNAPVGGLFINGNANTINIGADFDSNQIYMGWNGGTTGITMVVGSSAGTGFVLDGTTSSTYNVGFSTTTGTIVIGGIHQTGAITLGSSDGASIVNIGTGTGAATINIGNNAAAATAVEVGSIYTTSATTIQGGTGGITIDATAGDVEVVAATSSGSSTSPTLNARVGFVTITGLTTAATAKQAITIANTEVTATSVILATATNGGTNAALMSVVGVVPASNSVVITVQNNGAAALNGNLNITFWVLH